ncbi:MAG TPA: DUF4328 domain-containing protein [Labilithrix sp.]|nr:DUF4328 domain-containing protein [Labilithrix sp.]
MNVTPPARGQALGKAVLAAIGLRLALLPLVYVVNRALLGARPNLALLGTVFRVENGLRILTTLLVVVLFMIWVRAEIVALRGAGIPTKTTPLMAILGWFIPLANFVFPVLAVREVYRYRAPRLGALPILWWVSYLASMVTTNVALPFPIGMLVTLAAFGTWFALVWNVVMAPPQAAYGPGAAMPYHQPPPYYAPPPRM